MDVYIKSFHIHDVIYDAESTKFTCNFNINGQEFQRNGFGLRTSEDVIEEFKKIVNQHYTVKFESE